MIVLALLGLLALIILDTWPGAFPDWLVDDVSKEE